MGCQNTVIPNTVKTIGKYAFLRCNYLTEIKIPKSVTSIEDYAFTSCWGLETIISEITDVFVTGTGAFSGCSSATLYVPKGLVSTYQSTSSWNEFSLRTKEIPEKGDANTDGSVDISDVVSLVNRILGSSNKRYFYDTNDDGNVDISDVVILVNYIMEK